MYYMGTKQMTERAGSLLLQPCSERASARGFEDRTPFALQKIGFLHSTRFYKKQTAHSKE